MAKICTEGYLFSSWVIPAKISIAKWAISSHCTTYSLNNHYAVTRRYYDGALMAHIIQYICWYLLLIPKIGKKWIQKCNGCHQFLNNDVWRFKICCNHHSFFSFTYNFSDCQSAFLKLWRHPLLFIYMMFKHRMFGFPGTHVTHYHINYDFFAYAIHVYTTKLKKRITHNGRN